MYELDQQTATTLRAARSGDQAAFQKLTDPFRREILTHCYRMLGSLQDAEDQTQETFFAAWKKLETYQARGSFRAWLYKIATHGCLDALKRRPRRMLPQDLGEASDPEAIPAAPLVDPVFLEPFPDELLAPSESSPEARYEARESITLAFLTALQMLPPRQRSALILRDVLDWSVPEVAGLLQATVTATNSLLYRARSQLEKDYPTPPDLGVPPPAPMGDTEQLLDRYVQAWETADIEGLLALLTEDALFPMPPAPVWFLGRAAIRRFLAAVPLAGEARGRWRLRAIRVNGQPGFAFYHREGATEYQAYALQVLTVRDGLCSNVTTFGLPGLFPSFGLPLKI